MEQRRQAMLQPHLSDQQVYWLLRCDLYYKFEGIFAWQSCLIYLSYTGVIIYNNIYYHSKKCLSALKNIDMLWLHFWWFYRENHTDTISVI